MTAPPTRLHFDPFVLDIAAAQLSRDGQVLALRPKAFALLQALAQRPGELVSKDELLDTVWGRRFISEGVIKAVVAELRSVLADDPKAPRWIATVPRRGYRFAAAVQAFAAPQPADPLPRPDPMARPVIARVGNLPPGLEPPIGRDTALAALAGLLSTQRLVTLAGPSGIGKTRLLLALGAAQAPAWPDGVWLVELAALAPEATDPAALCALLAQTLQLGAAAAGSAASLARALQPLRLLLLLDNAEHLLPVLAPLVATLLPQAAGLRIVVTSQEPLRIAGEQVFRLAPLALPPPADDADAQRLMASAAVQLFVARVAARLPGFALAAQQQQAVADICRALDGLPLALELAAARVPLLGVHGIAELLLGADDGARLSLLSQGARNAAPRQRSLRDALAWSHGLLDDGQRRVLRRLAVFRGGFTLGAAQTVCSDTPLGRPSNAAGDDWGVLDALHALADKSLLAPVAELAEPAEPAEWSAPRFKLLESVRAFALEQLLQAGELPATQARHAQAVLAYWAQADARSLSDPALRWVTRHLPEIDNLRAALRWACADGATASGDEALALFNHTAMLWHRAGLGAEGQAWCEQLRGRSQASADAALRAGFELVVAVLGAYTSAYPTAQGQAAAQWAADAFEAQGDGVRAYFALYLLNQFTQSRSDAGREALLARMAVLEQADWGELLTRYGRTSRGYASRLAGRPDDYLAYCRDELARCRRLGAVAEAWNVAQGLMLAEHDVGAVAAALRVGREALAEIRAAGRLRQHAALLALWTTMLAESGDTAGARVALAETLPVLAGAGTPWMARIALCWLAANEGRDEAAARLLGWHDACVEADGRAAAGGYITRALQALVSRLQGLADAPTLQRRRAAGATLGDAGAQHLALQTAAAA